MSDHYNTTNFLQNHSELRQAFPCPDNRSGVLPPSISHKLKSPDPDPSRTWSPALVGLCSPVLQTHFVAGSRTSHMRPQSPSTGTPIHGPAKLGTHLCPCAIFVLIHTKIPLYAQTLVVHTVVSYTVALHIVVIHTVVPTFSHCSPVSLGLLGGGVESVGFLTTSRRRTS